MQGRTLTTSWRITQKCKLVHTLLVSAVVSRLEIKTLVSCRQEDDMGELNFNYDVSLLQGDDEDEATAVLDTQQQEQEDQEVLQSRRANRTSVKHKTRRNAR